MDPKPDSHILRRLNEAVVEAREHSSVQEEYTQRLNPMDIEVWREQIAQWQKDHTQLNPYRSASQGMIIR